MEDLERASELIDRALDSLAIAAVRHPERRDDIAWRCEHLREPRDGDRRGDGTDPS